jgi:RND family efflux transporter MFP subunit
MRYTEPNEPGHQEPGVAESELRKENQELRRQLQELKGLVPGSPHAGMPANVWRPSGVTIGAIVLAVAVLLVIAFLAGYVPLQKRQDLIRAEAHNQEQALPRVEVIQVGRSPAAAELELAGNVQAITEAPILARAAGYLQRRMADIGDRVKAGQPLAEIEAPELDQQVRQARAGLQQSQAALDQASANYEQGKADLEFARVTAERWGGLLAQGIASRQESDQYRTQYQSRMAAVQSLEKGVAVQRSNIASAEANLARLQELEGYRIVKAPFEGVITLRNVDVGALVNAGETLLFRIAQTSTVRAYVNVPQSSASFIRAGQPARLRVSNLPGRSFSGSVERTSNALDPGSRTMLVEVRVPNPDGALLPGMYAQVGLSSARVNPPIIVPADALIVQSDGAKVAVVRPNHTVHLQKIEVGRDYGDRLEVLTGLEEGDTIIPNPGDAAREGLEVDAVRPATHETGK